MKYNLPSSRDKQGKRKAWSTIADRISSDTLVKLVALRDQLAR